MIDFAFSIRKLQTSYIPTFGDTYANFSCLFFCCLASLADKQLLHGLSKLMNKLLSRHRRMEVLESLGKDVFESRTPTGVEFSLLWEALWTFHP